MLIRMGDLFSTSDSSVKSALGKPGRKVLVAGVSQPLWTHQSSCGNFLQWVMRDYRGTDEKLTLLGYRVHTL
jgi:hypothetical protein